MIVVHHRRNTLAELAATPRHLGVEMDVRMHGERVVVAHDPGQDGPDLTDWLDAYEHRFLIVDVKSEGVERLVLPELQRRGITEVFFLNLTTPVMWALSGRGERRIAARVSEIERVQTALAVQGRCTWAWVDGFFGFPLDAQATRALVAAGYRCCGVSPELQGHGEGAIEAWAQEAKRVGLPLEAVCTRHPERWVSDP